jgi:hypothetical protein
MRNSRRETLLKIGAAAIIGLFLLDRMIITPALGAWKAQGERIGALRTKIERGKQLLARENSLRARWEKMQRTDLPDDISEAESEVFKAIGRWAIASGIGFTNLAPQWRPQEDGYRAYECRASATGDQAGLCRLLYELETDDLPARLEECELTARDAKGKDLNATMRFSFVRIQGGRK